MQVAYVPYYNRAQFKATSSKAHFIILILSRCHLLLKRWFRKSSNLWYTVNHLVTDSQPIDYQCLCVNRLSDLLIIFNFFNILHLGQNGRSLNINRTFELKSNLKISTWTSLCIWIENVFPFSSTYNHWNGLFRMAWKIACTLHHTSKTKERKVFLCS